MKRFAKIMIVSVLLLSLVGCGSSKTDRYTGVGKGFNGDIVVEVVLSSDKITEIIIKEHKETPGISDAALKDIPERIIANQSLAIDTISGATNTSNGILAAVTVALESAGIILTTKTGNVGTDVELKDDTYDVVVIGAGGAGLAAAMEAKISGAEKVILIEKMPFAGGNTIRSDAEIASPGNWEQIKDTSIQDSPELMVQDMYIGGDKKGNIELITVLSKNILPATEWLKDFVRVDFQEKLSSNRGHSVLRAILPKDLGPGLIGPMVKKAEEIGIEIIYNTKATELVQDATGRVTGVKVENGEQTAILTGTNGIIIATGGFGANVEMRQEYNKKWSTLGEIVLTSNSPGIQGDGIKMAQAIGASLIDMEYLQLNPYGNSETGLYYYIDSARLNDNAIFVNKEGIRFVNELSRRDVVVEALLKQTDGIAYEIFNQEIVDRLKLEEKYGDKFTQAYQQGVLVKADTIEECAEFFGLDSAVVKATLDNYNEMVKSGKDTEFGRDINFGTMIEGPWYMVSGAVSIHHTMGGIEINTDAQVIDVDGNIISGLYAAGETTGGVHGANRLNSSSVADAIVFGRIAGASAAIGK